MQGSLQGSLQEWPPDLLRTSRGKSCRSCRALCQGSCARSALGEVRFLLQIESAAALPRLHEIAASSPRVQSMMLGSEDFSLDVGGLPTPEQIAHARAVIAAFAAADRDGLGATKLGDLMIDKPVVLREGPAHRSRT